jgi:HAD superfamily phosphoserine phosphatase-like hydrolase
MKTNHLFSKLSVSILALLVIFSIQISAQSYSFKPIKGFSDATNVKFEAFLNSTETMQIRKVAVFDCDGTLLGQAPYYLCDEAIMSLAERQYKDKSDANSKKKYKMALNMAKIDNVGFDYEPACARYFSGMTPEAVEELGNKVFHEQFQNKMYPEMKALIANLKNYGFEIWVITASAELLYQKFCSELIGIPEEHIIGVKTVVGADGLITERIVDPIPQDNGKAEAVRTFIKTRPLFVAGNSRGDTEMINTSVGLKMIINPNDTKSEKDLGGKTVKSYWTADTNCLIEYCNDVPDTSKKFVCKKYGVAINESHPKTSETVVGY